MQLSISSLIDASFSIYVVSKDIRFWLIKIVVSIQSILNALLGKKLLNCQKLSSQCFIMEDKSQFVSLNLMDLCHKGFFCTSHRDFKPIHNAQSYLCRD